MKVFFMQQTSDEKKFIPISIERGRARAWQKIRLSYSLLSCMNENNSRRLFLFRSEGQGFKKASSYLHNHSRFRSKKILLPRRERKNLHEADMQIKNEQRRAAIIGLKYGRKFQTLNIGTLQRARTAGIVIRSDDLITPYAEFKTAISGLLRSAMIGKQP
jgi:hypothetical protein